MLPFIIVQHIKNVVNDCVLGQPTKGSQRSGGMRLGRMEIVNCLISNGLSNFAEEMLAENSDRSVAPHPPSSRHAGDDTDVGMHDISGRSVQNNPAIAQ